MVRNYEAAIAKIGGTVVYSDPARWVTAKIVKDGREAWAQAEKGNGKIWLRIVEKKQMAQYIVADAAAFAKRHRRNGPRRGLRDLLRHRQGRGEARVQARPGGDRQAPGAESGPRDSSWLATPT